VESVGHPPAALGVALLDVTAADADKMMLPGEHGAIVSGVAPGSPAEAGGLQLMDTVVAWNDQRVETARELARRVREAPAGRRVELRVIRDGRAVLVLVELGAGEALAETAAPPVVPAEPEVRAPRTFGAWVVPVDAQMGAFLKLPEGVGLMVREVQPGSPAANAGIHPRDILLEMAGQAATSADGVVKALNQTDAREVEGVVFRRGAPQTVVLRY